MTTATTTPPPNDALALLERTTHARAFAPGPLPAMALRRIVDAGRNAPSLFNTQPFRFIVVRSGPDYERLRAACDTSRDTFMKMRGIFGAMNKRLKEPLYVAGLERQATGRVLPDHGHAIVVLQDDSFPEAIESCSCALMAMALEATSCGLASQFTSWTRGLSFQKDVVAWLGIAKPFKPFTSIIVGNPVTPIAPRSKERRSIDEAVRWL
jgi:nitroreductase